MTTALDPFAPLSRITARQRNQIQAMARPARVRIYVRMSGLGQMFLTGDQALDFHALFLEEPTLSFGCVTAAPTGAPGGDLTSGGGTLPGESGGTGAGTSERLSRAQVESYALAAGFTNTSLVANIAWRESSWRTDATGDTHLVNSTWGPSIGLMQVRSLHADTGTGRTRDRTRLSDPTFNMRSAYEISSQGSNFSPWSVCSDSACSNLQGRQLGSDPVASSGALAGTSAMTEGPSNEGAGGGGGFTVEASRECAGDLPIATATVIQWMMSQHGMYTGAHMGFTLEGHNPGITMRFSLTFEGVALRSTYKL